MTRWLGCLLLCFSMFAEAAPQSVKAVYQVTRNGQPFAEVTETFRQVNGRYTLESITDGIGVYGLFGKRRLYSEGEVTAEGLRPGRFEQQQGDDAKRSVKAEFDWSASTLTLTSKGKTRQEKLMPGTQDLASFAYQFMFVPPQGDLVEMPVTTGKKLRVYQLDVVARDVELVTPSGRFKTLHLINRKESGDDKQLWLGVDRRFIPVRILMQDDKGAKIEQVLTGLHVE